MKIRLLAALVMLSLPISAFTADSCEEVLQTEQTRIAALVADDYAALNRLLSDDLTYTHSNSSTENKKQFMESLISGQLKYMSFDHSDQKVRVYGNAALLTGQTRVYAIYKGKEVRPTLRFMILYVKKAGRWQFEAWQSTQVPST